ncbi:MAG: TIGR03936 family radical SAM-associated protein [Eubacteriales bacterium]|nr:TIGR03936 family radical SAM-associated protein [Eubacteriales bacterium]
MTKFSYLLSFAREGTPSWLGHLDLMVIFERSLRRADLPMLWSQGYNPRPALVFALPLGVGVECRRDLLEISLTVEVDPAHIQEALNAALPKGLSIVACQVRPPHEKSLMALVRAAAYRIEGPGLGQAWAELAQGLDQLVVERIHKGKSRTLELASYIKSWEQIDANSFIFACKAGSAENLRPDLLLKALAEYKTEYAEASWGARIIREALYLEGLPLDLAGPWAGLYNNF